MSESEGRLEVVKAMLAENVDVNAADDGSGAEITAEPEADDGFFTRLHVAAAEAADAAKVEELVALVVGGANVNARDSLGRSALHIACYYAHLEAVRSLLEAGSDPNARDNHCRTPLFYAVAGRGRGN